MAELTDLHGSGRVAGWDEGDRAPGKTPPRRPAQVRRRLAATG